MRPSCQVTKGKIGEDEVFQLIQYIKSQADDAPDETLRQNQQVPGQTQANRIEDTGCPTGHDAGTHCLSSAIASYTHTFHDSAGPGATYLSVT